jgi:glycosyltransferase involved in cell wall biosynthesis
MKLRKLNQPTRIILKVTGSQQVLISRDSRLGNQDYRPSAKVVVAIPCFNTERFIGALVSKARKYVDHVIVINDGSHDATTEMARGAGASVLTHETNKGYGGSIKSCFNAAKANDADILVILDGDGQHNPDEIPRVLVPILNGEADLVIGSRFLQLPQLKDSDRSPHSRAGVADFEPAAMYSRPLTRDHRPPTADKRRTTIPRYRQFGINIITFLYNFGSKTKVSDAQSGFRAYGRRTLGAISLTEKGMGVSIEIIVKARRRGFSIKEVPISCSYHLGGSTLNPFIHGLGVALVVIKLRIRSLLRSLIKEL